MLRAPQNANIIQPWVDSWDIHNYCAGIYNQGITMQKTWRIGCKTWVRFNHRLNTVTLTIDALLPAIISKHVAGTINLGYNSTLG